MLDENEEINEINKDIISTGHSEIDRKLGGGIPIGSLTLVEGQSDAGKSVLCQQMIWGSLNNGFKVLVFTTENTPKSLVSQMESLGLGIQDSAPELLRPFLRRALDAIMKPSDPRYGEIARQIATAELTRQTPRERQEQKR